VRPLLVVMAAKQVEAALAAGRGIAPVHGATTMHLDAMPMRLAPVWQSFEPR
jgi:hypothetical protein